ncbi:MAG: hypothetical protein IKJ31_02240 [Bacteroidaceae bacterium]|nr:hypothetical protein [Bacteroidaceae bacterium]
MKINKYTFYLHTVNGGEYEFEMCPISDAVKFAEQHECKSGIFLFLEYNPQQRGIPRYLFCGETENLLEDIITYINYAEQNNVVANSFCFYPEPSKDVCKEVINDIKNNYRFMFS